MITIQLPKAEDEWVERRIRSGEFSDPSDYISRLVRRDRDHEQRIEELKAMIANSLAGEISPLRVGDIVAHVDRRRAAE